tara:strand:- start:536 stop:934 length:399 start_codon:yes stop_codon:yes gene_type:complete
MVQILCAYPFLLEEFDWSPIISFFGLYWIDTQKKNIYSIYCILTIVSFLVDILKISMMREYKYDTIGQAWIDTIYILYVIIKFISLSFSVFYAQIYISDDSPGISDKESNASQNNEVEYNDKWPKNGDFIVE